MPAPTGEELIINSSSSAYLMMQTGARKSHPPRLRKPPMIGAGPLESVFISTGRFHLGSSVCGEAVSRRMARSRSTAIPRRAPTRVPRCRRSDIAGMGRCKVVSRNHDGRRRLGNRRTCPAAPPVLRPAPGFGCELPRRRSTPDRANKVVGLRFKPVRKRGATLVGHWTPAHPNLWAEAPGGSAAGACRNPAMVRPATPADVLHGDAPTWDTDSPRP